jgi:hypothetical protein
VIHRSRDQNLLRNELPTIRSFSNSSTLASGTIRSAPTKAHLLSQFPLGEYSGKHAVNAIIQHQFAYYDERLRRVIQSLASRDAAEFLLTQYDQASKILHGKNLPSAALRREWKEVEGRFRRAIKYMVELMCMQRPGSAPNVSKDRAALAMELALGLAEQAAGEQTTDAPLAPCECRSYPGPDECRDEQGPPGRYEPESAGIPDGGAGGGIFR